LGSRLSTRSSYSVPEYETPDLPSRNNEQVERAIQYNIKDVSSVIFSCDFYSLIIIFLCDGKEKKHPNYPKIS
jgi:hypothetical protein